MKNYKISTPQTNEINLLKSNKVTVFYKTIFFQYAPKNLVSLKHRK